MTFVDVLCERTAEGQCATLPFGEIPGVLSRRCGDLILSLAYTSYRALASVSRTVILNQQQRGFRQSWISDDVDYVPAFFNIAFIIGYKTRAIRDEGRAELSCLENSNSVIITMKWLSVLALALPATVYAAMPKGIDVSSYQPNVNWNTVKANGVTFTFIKATEGTG
jgi:hypothetical protein